MAVKNSSSIVVGVFQLRDKADAAVAELYDAGFRYDDIGVAARNESNAWSDVPTREITTRDAGDESQAAEGATAGAALGAGLGGLWGLGILTGALPAIGPVVAGGVLASLLASAAVGAAAGGLLGALTGLGVHEDDARYYEEQFNAGHIVVTVRTDGRADEARRILLAHGATGVDRRTPAAAL